MSFVDKILGVKRLTPLGYAVLYGGVGYLAYRFFGKPATAAPNPAAAASANGKILPGVNGLGSMISVAAPNGLTTATLTVYRNGRPMKIGEYGMDGQRRQWALSRVIDRGSVAVLVLSHPSGSQSNYQVNIDRLRGLRVAKMPVGV